MSKANQTDNHEHIILTANILILSDRLHEYASILAAFMQSHTDIHVIGIANNIDEAIALAQNQTVDFLIIAGYLKDVRNYAAIEALRVTQKKIISVHWAILDKLIIYYCYKYDIEEKFDRRLPLSDFADCLKELYRLCVLGEVLSL